MDDCISDRHQTLLLFHGLFSPLFFRSVFPFSFRRPTLFVWRISHKRAISCSSRLRCVHWRSLPTSKRTENPEKINTQLFTGNRFSAHCNQIKSRCFDCTRDGKSSRRKDNNTHRRSGVSGDRCASHTYRRSCWEAHRNWGSVWYKLIICESARTLFTFSDFWLFVKCFSHGECRFGFFVFCLGFDWFVLSLAFILLDAETCVHKVSQQLIASRCILVRLNRVG